jgi:hypothetical protein
MLLQAAPPDTSTYMIAGYVVFALIMAIYLVSLFARRRNLEQDLSTLESLQAESKLAANTAPAAAKPAAKAKNTRAKPGRRRQAGRRAATKR